MEDIGAGSCGVGGGDADEGGRLVMGGCPITARAPLVGSRRYRARLLMCEYVTYPELGLKCLRHGFHYQFCPVDFQPLIEYSGFGIRPYPFKLSPSV